jgi:hypothetical protein
MVVGGHPPLDLETNVVDRRPLSPFSFHLRFLFLYLLFLSLFLLSLFLLSLFLLSLVLLSLFLHVCPLFLLLRAVPQYRAAQSGVPVEGVAFWSRAFPLEFVRQFGNRTSVSGAVAVVSGAVTVAALRGVVVSGGDDIVKP